MSSVRQLQELVQQHKSELKQNSTLLSEEMEKNRILSGQVEELSEKLAASDDTIGSLQHQIQQMNQSDSLARARTQHESMLATMRQKHEADVLTLKEKLDDMKQALAWKVYCPQFFISTLI